MTSPPRFASSSAKLRPIPLPAFDAEKQSAIIPIRHMKFDFEAEKIDPKFYLNAELASAYFASLSIFLTYGEDLVIDTARYHRDFLTDPVLKNV
jgi:uncharacterized protein